MLGLVLLVVYLRLVFHVGADVSTWTCSFLEPLAEE